MELRAKVAAVLTDTEIAVNAGASSGVAENDLLTVYAQTVVTDPDTGKGIGTVNRPALRMRVTEIQEHLAVARSIEPATGLGALFVTFGPREPSGRSRAVKRVSSQSDNPSADLVLVRPGFLVVIEVKGSGSPR